MSEAAEDNPQKSQGCTKIAFKKSSKKNLRKRIEVDDDDAPPRESATLAEIRENQKLRERPCGVSLMGLTLGKKLAPEDEIAIQSPYSGKTGGLINMQLLRSGKLKNDEDAYDVGIGTQFSAETNTRDEDHEMLKFIELELQKRKGCTDAELPKDDEQKQRYLTPEEAALIAVPEHLRQASATNRSEEMLSNQMLNGIPEVDLGIDVKISNIEATENAKQKLLDDQRKKKDGPSQFVPANMAVNFMQHNRFNIEDDTPHKRRKANGQPVSPNRLKRATDDYHYDKFKKIFKRY